MEHTILIFTALMGAAVLGFLAAWTIQLLKIHVYKQEKQELSDELNDEKMAFNRLKSEHESQHLTIENLQRLLHEIESQSLASETEFKKIKSDYQQLSLSHQELLAHPKEKLREIEVIREVPVLVFRERPPQEDRREKAKKLVKAFKKGYLEE